MDINKSIAKMNDFYAMKKNAPIFQTEFGFYVTDRWKAEGFISDDTDFNKLFGYDGLG